MSKNVIVVTGANNGIGLSMTRTLIAEGYYVAALDISDENLIPLKASCPERLIVLDCDVTDAVRVNDAISSSWLLGDTSMFWSIMPVWPFSSHSNKSRLKRLAGSLKSTILALSTPSRRCCLA